MFFPFKIVYKTEISLVERLYPVEILEIFEKCLSKESRHFIEKEIKNDTLTFKVRFNNEFVFLIDKGIVEVKKDGDEITIKYTIILIWILMLFIVGPAVVLAFQKIAFSRAHIIVFVVGFANWIGTVLYHIYIFRKMIKQLSC